MPVIVFQMLEYREEVLAAVGDDDKEEEEEEVSLQCEGCMCGVDGAAR